MAMNNNNSIHVYTTCSYNAQGERKEISKLDR
jgi:hypothetical protein